MSTNFLFRPINAISNSLRSAYNEEEKRVVSSSSQQDEQPPQNNGAAVRTINGANHHASTVSPPLDESSATKLDNTEQENPSFPQDEYNPTETEKPDDKRLGTRPPRKRQRPSELDKLLTWNVTDGDGEIATTRRVPRGLKNDEDALAVTPSPRKKRARRENVESRFGMDIESGDEEPQKRAGKNVDPPIRYAEHDAMEEKQSESRKLGAPEKAVISMKEGDDEDGTSPPPKHAPLAKDETNNEGGDDMQGRQKRGHPKKEPGKVNASGPLRKMPSRRATKKPKQQGSFLYHNDGEMDGSDSSSDSPAKEFDEQGLNHVRDYDWLFGDDGDCKPSPGKDRGTEGSKKPAPWSNEEKLLCLLGLKRFGRANWEKIRAAYLPTWTARQIRGRAQKFLREQDDGKNIFDPLKGKKALLEKLIAKQHDMASKEEPSPREADETPREWTDEEELLFLYGLKYFGRGKWQEIHESFLPTRDRVTIRGHAQKFLQRQDEGKDIFASLRSKKALVEELIAANLRRNIPAAAIAPARTAAAAVSLPQHVVPARARKIYNVSVIEEIASAKLSKSMPKSAMKFCRDALKAWYVDAEKLVADSSSELASIAADLEPVRNGIAKLWCVYAQVVSKALKSGNSSLGEEHPEERTDFELAMLELARSCPLVGGHHHVVLARLDLEYGDHDFLRTVTPDTLEGFAGAIANVNVCETDKITEILSSAISMCNEAVRKTPGNRAFSLGSLSAGEGGLSSNEETTGLHCQCILDSISALDDSVTSLRSTWDSSHCIVDEESTTILCKEVNRLSRIKEALLESKNGENMGTEYGCDCGCWSVFANRRDLLDHQKSCRGNATAIGEHNRFERASISDSRPAGPVKTVGGRTRKQGRGFKKCDTAASKTGGHTWKQNGSKEHCLQVEYGCSHHGCLCVFATRRELAEHEQSCE